MLIGIIGPTCAGKHTTAEYLVQQHGFLRLHLPSTTSFTHPPASVASELVLATRWGRQPSVMIADEDLNARRLAPSTTDEKGTRGLTFPDVESLLDFVTKRWREHWVLTDIWGESTLDLLLRRPFFLLLGVDAPVGHRFERLNERCRRRGLSPMDLSSFIALNDNQLYSTPVQRPTSSTQQTSAQTGKGLISLLPHTHLQIHNTHRSPGAYHQFLQTLNLPSPHRLRPTWDNYFMTIAHLASQRSNCMKRRVGCVLVSSNKTILSTGYNGTPRGIKNCNAGGCPRCNSAAPSGSSGGDLATCLCLHAEENALLEAGRERIGRDNERNRYLSSAAGAASEPDPPGVVLYCDTCPCLTCSVKIAQVGVREVVYSQSYNMDDASRRVLNEAGVTLRQFRPDAVRGVFASGGIAIDVDLGLGLGSGPGEDGDDAERDLVVR